MPAEYLKRINITAVEEVDIDTVNTAYLKRVEIVEIVDSDGNPLESPAPNP